MAPVLKVSHLTKKFGLFVAVHDVSFSLAEGEILGFLGPNGAGKTTTIQMLLGVLTPTSGTVEYFGKDLGKNKSEVLEQVNFCSTYTNLPDWLTVKENLSFISYYYNISDRKKRVEEIRELFHLDEIFNKQTTTLSAGQLTRVNLAKAFLNKPRVLLLDEPTASLDPDVATYIRKFLLEERKKLNVSIIITSHNMAEVEEVCDRVIFINGGRLIANDTPTNLARGIKTSHMELLTLGYLQELILFCTSHNIPHKIDGKRVRMDIMEKDIAATLKAITDRKIQYEEISIEKPNLEDYFLEVLEQKHETIQN